MESRHLHGGIFLAFICVAATYKFQLRDDLAIQTDGVNDSDIKNYTNLGLLRLPVDIPRNTQVLLLDNNNLTSISDHPWTSDCGSGGVPEPCSLLPSAKVIDFSGNQIQSISSHAFHGMNQLYALLLRNNKLRAIPYDLFSDNGRLGSLSLSGNLIHQFHQRTFQNLAQLQALMIDGNNVDYIHCHTFVGLHKLIELDISCNSITKLHPNLFKDLGNLQNLRMSSNRLEYIPEELFKDLKNLKKINASSNRIAFLSPMSFSYSKTLMKVDFSHNSLRVLSRFLFLKIVEMAEVNFSFNCLESVYLSRIPVSLSIATNLSILELDTPLCTSTTGRGPCFTELRGQENPTIFHNLDFSSNNISRVIFSENATPHTLEILTVSFAGNPGLALPTGFVKQETFVIALDLNGTNLSWRNITLLNEILQLEHLQVLSMVGCDACESNMQQLLLSIFNPNKRVVIVCEDGHKSAAGMPSGFARDFLEDSSNNTLLKNDCDSDSSDDHSQENSTSTCSYPCHCFEKLTVINEKFVTGDSKFVCRYTMDCSYTSLSVLPISVPSLWCVLLSHNYIKAVEQNYFISSGSLLYLDLSFNSLSFLPGGVFRSLQKLKILKLNNNYLVHLNASLFNSLTSLVVLSLEGNRIFSYDPDVFANIRNLLLLSIDFRNLTTFHEETLHSLSRLRSLDIRETIEMASKTAVNESHFKNLHFLQSCSIVGFKINSSSVGALFNSDNSGSVNRLKLVRCALPGMFGGSFQPIGSVKQVALVANDIQDLDRDVFSHLSNLDYLHMGQNRIKSLRVDLFASTPSLAYLNMSHNQLSVIPIEIFDYLTKLEVLDISFNRVMNLDLRLFFEFHQIRGIFLQGNFIERIDISTTGNSRLCANAHATYNSTEMSLTDPCPYSNINNRTTIPLYDEPTKILNHTSAYINNFNRNALPNILGTQILHLKSNNIYHINNNALQVFPFLKIINLGHNFMVAISKYLFRNLKQLSVLDLRNNTLEFIEAGAFVDLHSLDVLNLTLNRLTIFDCSQFPKQNYLHEIYLNDNKIQSFNIALQMQHLKTVYVHNNPLSDSFAVPDYMPNIGVLDVSNTSWCQPGVPTFNNLRDVALLKVGSDCLQGMTSLHFTQLQYLTLLDASFSPSKEIAPDTHVSWKNLTMINYWFEMPQLDYLVLTGNPICEDLQWIQIMWNLFLSETWRHVICSSEYPYPTFIISRDGNAVLTLATLSGASNEEITDDF